MFFNNVPNNADISAIIIAELRNNYNIKYRKDKKQKNNPISGTQRIFHKPLSNLEFTEVTLSTGDVCEIPQFVVDATQRILEDVKVEGLFRKAGSAIRQKEIRDKLEYGQSLDHTYNVIDVANILKYFLRELSEALLPPGNFQETILRCLLCKGSNERRITAIKMVCLLLPQRHLNTLVYFMQFLNVVSQHSNQNKMSIKNLAIIFAPGLMPLLENNGQRLVAHVQIIEILIENAYDLGIVPSVILGKIQNIVLAESRDGATAMGSTSYSNDAPRTDSKKKKKRRSGSLTRMFNGIRKIVGAIGGSAEDLETTPEVQNTYPPSTPCLTKSTKKRKVLEANAFSNKKRKDVLELLPSGTLFPSTPMCIKPAKKSRISLGGKRYTKQTQESVATTAGTSTSARLSPENQWISKADNTQALDDRNSPTDAIIEPLAKKRLLEDLSMNEQPINDHNQRTDESYVKMSKSEYEDIKDRVSAIETRISREFNKLQSSSINDSIDSVDMLETEHLNGPEKVMDKYERTLEEIEMINSSPSTEQLANRLSRGLKIRRSAEQKVFRSPSARKIGNIRRRSQENVRLSRNKSWHLSNNCAPKESLTAITNMNTDDYFIRTTAMTTAGAATVNITALPPGRLQSSNAFYPCKITAKRTQTITAINQLCPSPTKQIPLDDKTNNIPVDSDQLGAENVQMSAQTPASSTRRALDFQLQNEKWVCADIFFDDSMSPSNFSSPSTTRRKRVRDRKTSDNECENTPNMTPRSANSVTIAESIKTPMLPPRLTSVKKAQITNSVQRTPYPRPSLTKTHLTPLLQQDYHQQGGRASIARLRSQNAGMVMAKAKLFDELGTDLRNNGIAKAAAVRKDDHQMNQLSQSNGMGMRRNILLDNHQPQSPSRKITPRKPQANVRNSPNGIQRRQNMRHLNYTPIKKSPLAMKTTVLSISATTATMESPDLVDTTPHIKRPLSIKNPRRLVRTPQNKRKAASPLRATTPFKYRNSPRLHAVK